MGKTKVLAVRRVAVVRGAQVLTQAAIMRLGASRQKASFTLRLARNINSHWAIGFRCVIPLL
jgi:hypothetical protein